MIYELITIDVVPGKLREYHDMWIKESLPVWEGHGIKHIGSWETVVGKSNEITRLFAYKDFNHYEQWISFLSEDEEGKKLRQKVSSYMAGTTRKIIKPF